MNKKKYKQQMITFLMYTMLPVCLCVCVDLRERQYFFSLKIKLYYNILIKQK